MQDKLANARLFTDIVAGYAKHYPYSIYPTVLDSPLPSKKSCFPLVEIYKQHQVKTIWVVTELLAFEGAEFAEATAQLLRGRPATESERQHFQCKCQARERLGFILKLDQENRTLGSSVQVINLGYCRFIWCAQEYFARKRLNRLDRLSWFLFGKLSQRLIVANLGEISMRQLVNMSINLMILKTNHELRRS